MVEAAAARETRIGDTLAAIPSPGFNFNVIHPSDVSGPNLDLYGLNIATGEIRVFVGAQALSGLAEGGAGAGSSSHRGQPGAATNPRTDYAPWGGYRPWAGYFRVSRGKRTCHGGCLAIAQHCIDIQPTMYDIRTCRVLISHWTGGRTWGT